MSSDASSMATLPGHSPAMLKARMMFVRDPSHKLLDDSFFSVGECFKLPSGWLLIADKEQDINDLKDKLSSEEISSTTGPDLILPPQDKYEVVSHTLVQTQFRWDALLTISTTPSDRHVTGYQFCQIDTARHDLSERMYGCVDGPSCYLGFRSSTSWKRHQSKSHYQPSVWVCGVKINSDQECICVFPDPSQFRAHLCDIHNLDEDAIELRLKSRMLGQNWSVNFWCGWCRLPVVLLRENQDAWEERFGHYMAHLHDGLNAGQWVHYGETKSKAQLQREEIAANKVKVDEKDQGLFMFYTDGIVNGRDQ